MWSFREFFKEESIAKSYAAARPSPPADLLNLIMDYVKEKFDSQGLTTAVDLACGSGQCTFGLAQYFQNVIGIDVSAAQIQEAENALKDNGLKNIQFQVGVAEAIPVADNSVQLITICMAAHYLDLDKVYAEGRRILVPGGVLAMFSYGVPQWCLKDNEAKDSQFQLLATETWERFKKYVLDSSLRILENQYRDITIPYNDLKRAFDFYLEREESMEIICESFRSWSFFHLLAAAEGKDVAENLLTTFKDKTVELLNSDSDQPIQSKDSKSFINKTKYFLVMARI